METESVGTRRRTGGEVKGKEANGVGSQQSSAWLGTVHPVLLQSFSADPHSEKARTRLNWHPRRYKWTRPFRWKTESGFCACAVTFRFHSTSSSLCGVTDQFCDILLNNVTLNWPWHFVNVFPSYFWSFFMDGLIRMHRNSLLKLTVDYTPTWRI